MSPKIEKIVLVNLSANDGKAESKWLLIRDKVIEYLGKTTYVISFRPPFDLSSVLSELLGKHNIDFIVSAGGDGSLNHLLNYLMTISEQERKNITIGAIGLGSSNDALKPFDKKIYGIPVNIDLEHASLADVGEVLIGSDNSRKKYFLNNISYGVTAKANALFNKGDFFINLTKRKLTNIAIIYAALKTIMTHKNNMCEIEYDNKTIRSDMSSLSIIKTPYLAGILRYDQNIKREDGKLGVNLCDKMTKLELIRTVMALTKSKFSGRPKCTSVLVQKLRITFGENADIEVDGEINRGLQFDITLKPKAIRFISSPI